MGVSMMLQNKSTSYKQVGVSITLQNKTTIHEQGGVSLFFIILKQANNILNMKK